MSSSPTTTRAVPGAPAGRAGKTAAVSPTAKRVLIAMGVATYLTRLSGFYLLRGLNVSGPMKAALDALPPAVLMATLAASSRRHSARSAVASASWTWACQ